MHPDSIDRVKRQLTDWEEVFATHIGHGINIANTWDSRTQRQGD